LARFGLISSRSAPSRTHFLAEFDSFRTHCLADLSRFELTSSRNRRVSN
jgi:hypothetical protein